MKTKNWIKLIGTLCITFGFLGLIACISAVISPVWTTDSWPEINPDRLWKMEILSYIGIAVNIIYFLAGVFFLIKKSFSMNLMYAALIISILYVLISLLVVEPFDSKFFIVLSPIIDASLLIAVYRIRNYYFDSPDQIVHIFGGNNLNPTTIKFTTFTGILLISIPILIQFLWIYVFNTVEVQAERISVFHSYFPEFLHGQNTLNYLSLACCIFAVVLSSIGFNSKRSSSKKLNSIVLVISCILLLLNLFQLM